MMTKLYCQRKSLLRIVWGRHCATSNLLEKSNFTFLAIFDDNSYTTKISNPM